MNGPKAAAACRLQVTWRNATTLVILITGLALLCAPSVQSRSPLLIWNGSASVPIGLYRVYEDEPAVGSLALVRSPGASANLAQSRGYLTKTAYLLKPVVAVAGDRVCRIGAHIIVGRRNVARALLRDAAGRRMPMWWGCRTLHAGQIFLLAEHPNSFDSRYFGPIDAGQVAGIAIPVWH